MTENASFTEEINERSDLEVISMRQSRSIRSQSIDISMQFKTQAEQNGKFFFMTTATSPPDMAVM